MWIAGAQEVVADPSCKRRVVKDALRDKTVVIAVFRRQLVIRDRHVKHTMYASSLAVNGKQFHYGDRPVTEDDLVHGE